MKNTTREHLYSLINHLIADLLYVRKSGEEVKTLYRPFTSFLKYYDKITFPTLNHDTLLEFLLHTALNKEFSDGFTKEQFTLFSETETSLPVFIGDFTKKIIVLKLHGSINLYKYEFFESNDEVVMKRTGEYLYYKTANFHEKQFPIRKDPKTGTPVQNFHLGITPQFITGTNKVQFINGDKMYSSLYMEFQKSLMNQVLVLIGYSYGDAHINLEIDAAVSKGWIKHIINVNPGNTYLLKTNNIKVTNLKYIDELTIL